MMNVTLQRVDQSVKQLIDGHTTISDNCLDTQHPALSPASNRGRASSHNFAADIPPAQHKEQYVVRCCRIPPAIWAVVIICWIIDESGESTELMEGVSLKELAESELEISMCLSERSRQLIPEKEWSVIRREDDVDEQWGWVVVVAITGSDRNSRFRPGTCTYLSPAWSESDRGRGCEGGVIVGWPRRCSLLMLGPHRSIDIAGSGAPETSQNGRGATGEMWSGEVQWLIGPGWQAGELLPTLVGCRWTIGWCRGRKGAQNGGQQPGLRCSGACVARNMTGGRDRRPDAGYGKPTGPPSDAARRSVKILVLFLVSYWSRLKRPHSGSVGARWSETWARCDKESCSSHGGSCFGVEVWTDAAKLKNMVIAIFGDRWDLVRKSDVFIEYEADVSSWVSGVKWGVVDFGKLLPMIVSRHSCIWYAVKQTSNPLIASAERQMTIIPLAG